MDYDATIKLLITANSETFFELIGAPSNRELCPTEVNKPVVLRFDHLSKGVEQEDLLHIEFQSKWEEMRWRMLEYYSALSTAYKLQARPSTRGDRSSSVRQIVFLVGAATPMRNLLQRDGTRFAFEVRWLREVDPDRRLLQGQDPAGRVLGLLCVEQPDTRDWAAACRRIGETLDSDPQGATDAFALLLAVETLIPAPRGVKELLKEMTMQIDIRQSEVLQKFRRDIERDTATAFLKDMLEDMGETVLPDDEAFISVLEMEDVREVTRRLRRGGDWDDIRGYRPTVQPPDII